MKRTFKEKECEICGKTYIPNSSRQKFCKPRHDIPCPTCGKIMRNKLSIERDTSCKECGEKQRKQTMLDKYGGTSAFYSNNKKESV